MKTIQITPDKSIEQYVHKITVFLSDEKKIFYQKLTPSPFTCISYNHYKIPKFKVGSKFFYPKSRLQFTGPKTFDNIYAVYNNKVAQILIELAPTSFYYLFGQSPTAIVNRTCSFLNFTGRQENDKLAGSLANSSSYLSHIKILTGFLKELSTNIVKRVDYIENAISLIDEMKGDISVSSVCDHIFISERQFDRRFREIVGIPPIQYLKIRQLHFVINQLYLKHYRSLKEVAYETGFYDPAHFAKFFKKLTGMTTGEFLSSKEHIALEYFSELV